MQRNTQTRPRLHPGRHRARRLPGPPRQGLQGEAPRRHRARVRNQGREQAQEHLRARVKIYIHASPAKLTNNTRPNRPWAPASSVRPPRSRLASLMLHRSHARASVGRVERLAAKVLHDPDMDTRGKRHMVRALVGCHTHAHSFFFFFFQGHL